MRKIYYVFPKIQSSISLIWTASVVIELMFFGITLALTEHFTTGYPRDIAIYVRFATMMVVILVFTVVNLMISIRLTHRFAGPLVQVQRVLDKARRGDYSVRVQMRNDDYLHEFGSVVNMMLQGLEESRNLINEMNSSFEHSPAGASNRTRQLYLQKSGDAERTSQEKKERG